MTIVSDASDLARRIRPLLAFLPTMESRHAGRWDGGEKRPDGSITSPWFEYDDQVLQFIRACGQNGWIEPFDWNAWQAEALEYVQNPRALLGAGPEEIGKLLTLHVRRDRFFEGHLAAMIENGHMAAILRRLEAILANLDS